MLFSKSTAKQAWAWVRQCARQAERDEGMDFSVRPDPTVDVARPLLVVVHPGDASEYDHPHAKTRTTAHALIAAMGREIEALAPTHQIAIVHRASSGHVFVPLSPGRCAPELARALETAHGQDGTAVAFGDRSEPGLPMARRDHEGRRTAWRVPHRRVVTP